MINGMSNTSELYVYPYPLHTAAATKTDPMHMSEDFEPWEQKKAGEYLYLHPYWYVYDEQEKLCLIGKTGLKSDGYKVQTDGDDFRLELEMLIHMPIEQRLTIAHVMMNSMMVLTSNSGESEHMFHAGSHVVVAKWLYKVNKKGVLQSVGKLKSLYHNERIDECLLMMGIPSTCEVNVAPAHKWKDRTSVEEEPETKEELILNLIESFKNQINKREKLPQVGDEIEATTKDGYKIEAYCVPGNENAPIHPEYGKASFAMAIRIYNPDGTVLTEDAK